MRGGPTWTTNANNKTYGDLDRQSADHRAAGSNFVGLRRVTATYTALRVIPCWEGRITSRPR